MHESTLSKWSGRVAKFLGYIAAAGIFSLMALVFTSVFFRYVLKQPILATEDMMAILLGVTIFTAVPQVTLGRSHITVELFVAPFKKFPAINRARKILIDIGIVCMSVYMGTLMVIQATRQFDRETESFVMEWPLWPGTAVFAILIFIGGVLFAIRAWRDKGHSNSSDGMDL